MRHIVPNLKASECTICPCVCLSLFNAHTYRHKLNWVVILVRNLQSINIHNNDVNEHKSDKIILSKPALPLSLSVPLRRFKLDENVTAGKKLLSFFFLFQQIQLKNIERQVTNARNECLSKRITLQKDERNSIEDGAQAIKLTKEKKNTEDETKSEKANAKK